MRPDFEDVFTVDVLDKHSLLGKQAGTSTTVRNLGSPAKCLWIQTVVRIMILKNGYKSWAISLDMQKRQVQTHKVTCLGSDSQVKRSLFGLLQDRTEPRGFCLTRCSLSPLGAVSRWPTITANI